MTETVYRELAKKLNALPQGFPPTEDGSELRLLEYLFTPEEALLTSQLKHELENMKNLLTRIGRDRKETLPILKGLTKRGLIRFGRGANGSGFALEPFVVGFYEAQASTLTAKLAVLFENYYQQAFGDLLHLEPKAHRIIPVHETIENNIEVQPYESVIEIVDRAKSYAVQDCICRKQKELIGDPCDHPMEVCLIMSPVENSFTNSNGMRAITRDETLEILKQCSEVGLVHSVSNTQEGNYYICNCCTCSCGFLRGMADLGIANVMARSAFVVHVDESLCIACGACMEACSFNALTLEETIVVNEQRCMGCGVCVHTCPTEALKLIRRPEDEIKPIPKTHKAWGAERLSQK